MLVELSSLEKRILDALTSADSLDNLVVVPVEFLGVECNAICWLNKGIDKSELSPMVLLLREDLQSKVNPLSSLIVQPTEDKKDIDAQTE